MQTLRNFILALAFFGIGLFQVGCTSYFDISSLSSPANVLMKTTDPVWDSGDGVLKAQISLQLAKDIALYEGTTPVIVVTSTSGLGFIEKAFSTLGIQSHSMNTLSVPVCTVFDATGKATCEVSSSDEGQVEFSLLEPKFDIPISVSMTFYAPPTLTAISPTAAGHDLEQTLTLAGDKFRDGVKIFIDGTQECANVVRLAATTLSCRLPVMTVGAKSVTVQNKDLQEAAAIALTVYDATPPLLEWVSPALGAMAQSQLQVEVSCEVGLPVQFAGSGLLSAFSANCDTGTLVRNIFFSTGEGAKTITLTQTKGHGVTTTRSRNFIRDNTPPNVTVTSPSTPYNHSTGSVAMTGTCEGGLPVDVYLDSVLETTVTCDGTQHWSHAKTFATEGVYTYQFRQTDAAGNVGEAILQIIEDRTVPALSFSGGIDTLSVTSAGNFYIFSGQCESPFAVSVQGQDSASAPCSNGSWSYQTTVQTVDGVYAYQFRQTDLAGNQKVISSQWTRNTQGPVLTLSGNSQIRTAETAHTFNGTCETGLPISVSGAETSSVSCPAGVWSYTTGSLSEGSHSFVFAQTNGFSITTSVNAAWVRDTTAPVTGLLEVVGGSPIGMPYAKLNLRASDAAGFVTGFCVKIDSATAPAANASCWEPVSRYTTPSSTVTISSFTQLISFTGGTYTVYLWWKDDLGNTSSSASALSVTYTPIPPPSVSTVLASNSAVFDDLRSERQLPTGQTVHLKWKASGVNLSANPVSVYFTTDDKEWTLVKDNLLNGVNGSCVLNGSGSKDDDMTGCYIWSNSSPVSSYYRIRVSVKNTSGAVVFANSSPINVQSLDLIAGNTESGAGGSASAAIFLSDPESQATVPKTRSLVVTQKGIVYINDFQKGVLTVEPSTGFLKVFIPKRSDCIPNASIANVASACVKEGMGIVLDQNEDLLIHDGDRIRKVYLSQSPQRIETIIGGGSNSSDSVTNPLQYKMATPSNGINRADYFSYKVLPNNDILLVTDSPDHRPIKNGGGARLYSDATKTLSSLNFAGVGTSFNASVDIRECGLLDVGFSYTPGATTVDEFLSVLYVRDDPGCDAAAPSGQVAYTRLNPLTYQVDTSTLGIPTGFSNSWGGRTHVGKNGKIYSFVRSQVREYVPNGSGGSFVPVLGTGTLGHCAAGAVATSCQIDIDDLYVTRSGTIFFLSRNAIRMVDDSGRVREVFGQAIGTGDGTLAKDIRFGMVSTFDRSPSGHIAVYESGAFKIREFDEGGAINTVIGNGNSGNMNVGAGAPSKNQPLPLSSTAYEVSHMFYVGDNDIVFNTHLFRLALWNRTNAYATNLTGLGSVDYRLVDSVADPNDSLASRLTFQPAPMTAAARILPIGSYNGQLLVAARGYTTTEIDSNLLVMNGADSYRTSTLLKSENPDTISIKLFCLDGTDLWKCNTPISQDTAYRYPSSPYSVVDGGWLTIYRATPRRVVLLVPGGVMNTLVTLQQDAFNLARASYNGREYLFYCSEQTKQLRRVDITNPATPVETEMPWEISSYQCYGRSLIYDVGPDGPRLLFQLSQNGLYGIGEYLDPFRSN